MELRLLPFLRTKAPDLPASISVATEAGVFEVRLRRNPRARRLILRQDLADGGFVLVVPPRVKLAEARGFAERTAGWMRMRQAKAPARVAFVDGAVVPILGVDHVIRHRPDVRRPVVAQAGELLVSGQAEHVPRRVADHLKRLARAELGRRAREKARLVDRAVTRVGLRDPRTRWGSCTGKGALSFSWRLILAPEIVLDYVVAHEVAHLVEMNHGPRFWRLAAELSADADAGQAWLKAHGAALHRYG